MKMRPKPLKMRLIVGLWIWLAASPAIAGSNADAECAIDLDPSTHGYSTDFDAVESVFRVDSGDERSICAIARNVSNLDSWRLDLVYDPTVLSFSGASDQSAYEPNILAKHGGVYLWMPPKQTTPGRIRVAAALCSANDHIAPDGAGILACFKFNVLTIEQNTKLTIENAVFIDPDRVSDTITRMVDGQFRPVDRIRPAVEMIPDTDGDVFPALVTIRFSEPVTGFDINDIDIRNGKASDFSGNGAEYAFLVNPEKPGDISVAIPENSAFDQANNGNTTAPSLNLSYTPPNRPPEISGTPQTDVQAGTGYAFQPAVSDPDEADALVFEVANLPAWAEFDTKTGHLSGIPSETDVGVWPDIGIQVTDSAGETSSLPPFQITVNPPPAEDQATNENTPPGDENDAGADEDPAGENQKEEDGGETPNEPAEKDKGGNGGGCFMRLLF